MSTIVGISTALGQSGINIIRISGKDAKNIINKIFRSNKKLLPNNIIYGKIYDEKNIVDEVLVSYFKAPFSYTGEDVCEVNCHGGTEVTREILNLILKNGARLAEAGEFSKIAFINGKMDLTKAESIIDLINAKTKTEKRISLNNSEGMIYKSIEKIKNNLLDLISHIEVSVDYPEYDYEELSNSNIIKTIENNLIECNNILNTYEQGKYIKNGINVAILGSPNVGKSSLLNCLSKNNKAIVTDIEGTTRDIVEDTINIGDIILNLADTAGIRESKDF